MPRPRKILPNTSKRKCVWTPPHPNTQALNNKTPTQMIAPQILSNFGGPPLISPLILFRFFPFSWCFEVTFLQSDLLGGKVFHSVYELVYVTSRHQIIWSAYKNMRPCLLINPHPCHWVHTCIFEIVLPFFAFLIRWWFNQFFSGKLNETKLAFKTFFESKGVRLLMFWCNYDHPCSFW